MITNWKEGKTTGDRGEHHIKIDHRAAAFVDFVAAAATNMLQLLVENAAQVVSKSIYMYTPPLPLSLSRRTRYQENSLFKKE